MERRLHTVMVYLSSKGVSGSLLDESTKLGAEFGSIIKRNLKAAAGVALFYAHRKRGTYVCIKELAEKLQLTEKVLRKAISAVRRTVKLPIADKTAKFSLLDKLLNEYDMLSDRDWVRAKAMKIVERLTESRPEVAAAVAFITALQEYGERADFEEIQRLTRASKLAVNLALKDMQAPQQLLLLPAKHANKISPHEIALARVSALVRGHQPPCLDLPNLKVLEAERELLDAALSRGAELCKIDFN
mmetsp:Transcript_26559/g.47710  ORF Transcript_26559/g.47710 Transcript_26559/m.47710 type:complete len:245 (-) Transcript_26559:3-737(-)